MRIVRTLVAKLTLPVLLLGLWWLVSLHSANPYWPPLKTILSVGRHEWLGERIHVDVIPSLLRLVVGFSVATVLGIAIGTLVSTVERVRIAAEPILEFARAVPPPVLIPLLMVMLGIGGTPKIVIIAFGSVWPVLLNTVLGVRSVDPVVDETARSYGIHGLARVRLVMLPAAAPQIVAGMRQALSISVIVMVVSEMMAATSGLGFTLVQFQRSFALPEMWSGMIVLGVIGAVLAGIFGIFERRVLAWYLGMRRLERGER